MPTTITDAGLELAIADAVVAALGANCQLIFYTGADAELATLTSGTATANAATAPDSVDITTLADDTTAADGTVSYAVLTTSLGVEILRFDDPVNDIGLSSATFVLNDTVSVTSLSVTVPQ